LSIYKQSVASIKLWTTNNQSLRQKNVFNCKKSIAFSRTVLQRAKLFANIVFLVVYYIFVYKSKKQPCNYKVLDASMKCAVQKNNNLCSRRSLLGANQFGVTG
jgi:Ca2+/Na+ antiporter